jgi:hypothetical protein
VNKKIWGSGEGDNKEENIKRNGTKGWERTERRKRREEE